MFDQLVDAALGSRASAAVGAWARVENAACARRLFAMADELERMLAADGSVERDQWCLDNWDAVAASVAAAQNVSLGVASHQLLIADGLRKRLPRVAEVFAAGAISYRMVAAVVSRTRLIKDPDALAKVDTEIAAHVTSWASLSVDKTQNEIDYWVDRYDPAAVRRTEDRVRGRYADVRKPEDGSGTADIEARLLATDAEALDQRLDAMAGAVCDHDSRTLDQRRADALGALGHGADRLACQCEDPQCPAAGAQPSAVIVHVIAHEDSLTDDTPAQLDGEEPARTDRDAAAGDDDHRSADRSTATTDRTRRHPAGGHHGWRRAARPVVGRQDRGHRQDRADPSPGHQAPATALHPFGGVGDVHPVPGYDVPLPGLRRTRAGLRYRPHHRLPHRTHPGLQSEMPMPKTPPTQNLRRLARPTMARRHRRVDLTARADLHHPPRQPNTIPHPVQTHRSHVAPSGRCAATQQRAQTAPRQMPRRTTNPCAKTAPQRIEAERQTQRRLRRPRAAARATTVLGRSDGEQMPLAGDTLELVSAAVLELES